MGNKIYYECPGCGDEVWAYKGFVGTRCWNCPGTIISGITNATPGISHIKTAAEAMTDTRTKYKCPTCGDSVWAYGQFSGQSCWKCKSKNPIGGTFDILTGSISTPAIQTYKLFNPFETMNESACGISGDGGHHINISNDYKGTITKIWIRKSDLCWTGLNTLAATFRIVLAPVSSVSDSKTFWIEHWWLVCKLKSGGYIVTYKQKWGIYVHYVSSWDTANSTSYNGMGTSVENKNMNTVKSYDSHTRSVKELVQKIKSMNSYYHLNSNNCQDYADELYDWF